ncbi:alpha/beta hydrolase [Aquibium carbonis]|uniref:Alpha/beta hydrolase n=1 Tax=Aquibium carbonis TaxID=2495581 RepID=A0A3S0A7E8_9HYPH|nr:alpha/beta hydrolase [Aquibium carbonis]RST85553.1 alpha/beta hydrolase [Aquibium carbonis]
MRLILLFVTGVLVSALLVAASAYRRDMAIAGAAADAPSRLLDGPDGTIEYADTGRGSPVLMIHGSGGGFDQGLAFAGPLTEAGFRVIAPSRFGYLRSVMPQAASPERQADAFAFLLDAVGVDQAVVVGGSAGALSATQFAIRHPSRCRALILVVPASYAPDRPAGTNAAPAAWPVIKAALGSDMLFWAAIRMAPAFMTRMVLATDPALLEAAGEAERQRVRNMLFHVLPVSRRKAGLLMDMATAGDPPPHPLETITCPVLAISAKDDLYGTAAAARHIAARAPDARLLLFDDGGHMLVGHDAAMWRAVLDFIEASGGGNR